MDAFLRHPSIWLRYIALGLLALFFVGTFFEERSDVMARLYPQPSKEVSAWVGHRRRFRASVVSEVDRYANHQEALIEVENGDVGRGAIIVRLYPELERGSKLNLGCSPRNPEEGNGRMAMAALRLRRVFWMCRYPKIELLSRKKDASFSWLFGLKQWGIERINRWMPEPHASLLAGLLFGVRRSMPEAFTEALRKTGTVHIIAISGYNISLILNLVLGVMNTIGFPRWMRVPISTASLLLFVILTGGSASVVRAAIMGGLGVLALSFGRKQLASHLLIVAAAVMAMAQPRIVRYDVGFQLSVLATLGLTMFASFFERTLERLPETFALRQTVAATLASNLTVLPLLILYFGSVSLIAVPVNALMLPMIPWVMLTGAAFLFFSALVPGLSGLLALPCLLLLHVFVRIILFASHLPFAQWVVERS